MAQTESDRQTLQRLAREVRALRWVVAILAIMVVLSFGGMFVHLLEVWFVLVVPVGFFGTWFLLEWLSPTKAQGTDLKS